MKSCVRAVFATALAAAASFTPHQASADFLFGWNSDPLTNYGPSPWAATSQNPNLVVGGLTRGPGLDTGGTAVSFDWGAEGWTNTEAAAITSQKYATFTVTPNPGYTIALTNISVFNYRRIATGPTNQVLQYSFDGASFTDFKTNALIATTTGNLGPISLTNVAALQSVGPGTTLTIRIVNYGSSAASGTWYINDPVNSTNDFVFLGTLTSSGVAPTNLVVTPANISTNFGTTAVFTAVAGGDAPTYAWYQVVGGVSNLLSATTATLTLSNLTGANSGQYVVVLSNNFGGPLASTPVSLSVSDPFLKAPANSTYGLTGGQAQFFVNALGTSLAYQWYYADTSGNILGKVVDGVNTYSPSTTSGSQSALLTISGLTATDPTNFVVVVSNNVPNGNAVTNPVVSLVAVGASEQIAFWNFNGQVFSNNIPNPPPYYGVGTAAGLNEVPFAGVLDGNDGAGLNPPFGLGGPPFGSWGCSPGAAQGASNKTVGIQFMTSTVGARKITVSYDARATGTASAYSRLQYTTNGATWTDYPNTRTFGTPTAIDAIVKPAAQGVTGYTASSYRSFNGTDLPGYDLTGFAGVDNNPNFGIRIVSEWESTGTYGASPNTNYYGIANTYGTTGTLTYDLLSISGQSITNHSAPPTIGPIANTNVNDFQTVAVNITVNDTANSPNNLVLSASSLGVPLNLDPSRFQFSGTGTNRTMTITPFIDEDGIAPVLVTATDPVTGLSAATWFYLQVITLNLPPTNSLVAFGGTNILVTSAGVSIPFTAAPVHPADSNLVTYSAVSGNNAVIPTGNISFNTSSNGHPILTIVPTNQIGAAPISVTVSDNDPTEPRITTATFTVQVVPNTNIVLADYFNYDASGPLDVVAASLWTHLSGNGGQLQVGGSNPGYATINTITATENLQAKLAGAPYSTTNANGTPTNAVLYASFVENMTPGSLPVLNGSHFALFNDGTGNTANIACRIMAATNGAVTGDYRLGISNGGGDATTSQMFPMDLVPGSNYVVVVQLVVSNNQSTIWVAPTSPTSPSVTDTTVASPLFNIGAFELRESGGVAGVPRITFLKVGTTFDSVFPSIHVTPVGKSVIVNWSDPTLSVLTSTNNLFAAYLPLIGPPPVTNLIGTNVAQFYRFGPNLPPGGGGQ